MIKPLLDESLRPVIEVGIFPGCMVLIDTGAVIPVWTEGKGSDRMRMTREEMAKRYPNHCLGLRDAVYPKDDDVNFISAEVVYTDKSN